MRFSSILNFALTGLLLMASLMTFAAPFNELNEQKSSSITFDPSSTAKRSFLFVGARIENFDYNEPVMTSKGLLYGVGGYFQYHLQNESLIQVNFELLTGRTDYTGSTWEQEPVTASNQFSVYEVSSEYQFHNLYQQNATLVPLVGGGVRGTFQNKESAGDYRREYYYLYVIGGLQLEIPSPVDHHSSIIFRAQKNILVAGANNTHLSDARSDLPDVLLKFTSGSAYRVEIQYNHQLADLHQVQFALNYTSWSIQQSEYVEIGEGRPPVYEPENQTYLMGLNLSYLF